MRKRNSTGFNWVSKRVGSEKLGEEKVLVLFESSFAGEKSCKGFQRTRKIDLSRLWESPVTLVKVAADQLSLLLSDWDVW